MLTYLHQRLTSLGNLWPARMDSPAPSCPSLSAAVPERNRFFASLTFLCVRAHILRWKHCALFSLYIWSTWSNIIQDHQNLRYYLLIIFPSAEALKWTSCMDQTCVIIFKSSGGEITKVGLFIFILLSPGRKKTILGWNNMKMSNVKKNSWRTPLRMKTVDISVSVGAHNKNWTSERWGELYLEGYGNCDLRAAHHVPMKGLKDKQVQPLSKVHGDNLCWSPF